MQHAREEAMLYRTLADLIVALHLLFIIYAVGGGILAFWRPWNALLHLPAAAWGVFVEFSGIVCPLTPLENRFRQMAGEAGYTGGFIEQHLIPLIYPAGLTAKTQIILGLFVVTVNLLLYSFLLCRRMGRRKE
jgi:hypothetical protein